MSSEVLKIEEDVVSSTIGALHRDIDELIDDEIYNITLDFSSVDVIDSTGIGFVIRVQNSLKQHDGTLVLKGVNSDIMKMMRIMRLDQHFEIQE